MTSESEQRIETEVAKQSGHFPSEQPELSNFYSICKDA